MADVREFRPHLLLMGILSALPEEEEAMEEALQRQYGPVAVRSPRWDFTFTRYYTGEMGEEIQRYFLVFRNPVDPSRLADIKLSANELEGQFSREGSRQFNIDPGLLSLERLILASAKDRGNRIPLKSGIYAEVTLLYMHGSYAPLPWSYADYRSDECRNFFEQVRNTMLK